MSSNYGFTSFDTYLNKVNELSGSQNQNNSISLPQNTSDNSIFGNYENAALGLNTDYSTAYEIYQCLTTIYDGINDEQNEINELYKEERIKLDEKIKSLRQKDEDLFEQKIKEYNIVVSSNVYKEYLQLKC